MITRAWLPGLLSAPLVAASFYNGPGHSLHWLSICAVLLQVWIARSLLKQDLYRFRFSWGWVPAVVLVYLGWLAVSPQFSTYPYASWVQAAGLALLPLAALGWLLQPGDDKEQAWARAWHWLLAFGLALAAWGISDLFVVRQRAHGPLIDANAFAALINLFLVPSAYAYLTTSGNQKGWRRAGWLLTIVSVLALAAASTLSRGAVIALVFSFPLLLWASKSGANFRRRLPRLILVLVAAYMIVKLVPIPDDRTNIEQLVLAPMEQARNDQAIQQRLLLWRSTWQMIGESNLLVGSGIGTFVTHYPAHRSPEDRTFGSHAHNDYLQALFEGGIIQLLSFVALIIGAPLWLLYRLVTANKRHGTLPLDISPGLLIGVLCIGIHALVNFIHYVAPIAFLTGLYLARAWEQCTPRRGFNIAPKTTWHVKPRFVTVTPLLIVSIPVAILLVDGVIFKLFSSDGALASRLDAQQRFAVLNAAIALRPGNPMPRLTLIRHLIDVAETAEPGQRERLLRWAMDETGKVQLAAPSTALPQFFQGEILALRGELRLAQTYYEIAMKRAPHSTMMRAKLVKLYRELGQRREAERTVSDAKQWLRFETSMSSLAAFAREAQRVEHRQQNSQELEYWSQIEVEAERLAKNARVS